MQWGDLELYLLPITGKIPDRDIDISILKYEIESIIDKYVPLKKKQGKWSRKNTCQKELLEK